MNERGERQKNEMKRDKKERQRGAWEKAEGMRARLELPPTEL